MAIVAVSVAPAAVLSAESQFASGGIVEGGPYFVGERVSESTITHEQMKRIKKLINEPDYYSRPLQSYCYWKTEVKP